MNYRQAAKLHNRDEIILKATGEVGYVLSARPRQYGERKLIELTCQFPQAGYCEVAHTEVR